MTAQLLPRQTPPELSPLELQRLHSRIINDSDQGILITDAHEHIVSVNAAFSKITGYSFDEAIGQTTDLLRSGVHDAEFRAKVTASMAGAGPWQGEIIGRRKNGELFPQNVSISVVRDATGNITHAFSIFSDISVLHEAQARIVRLANFDDLTGLPNRSHFIQLTEVALASSKRTQQVGAILMVDLERLSTISDSLGLDVADELLKLISQRFRLTLRSADVLAKVGADQFVVALLNLEQREHAGIVAKKLLSAMDEAFQLAGQLVHVGVNVGIAVFPDDAQDVATLLRCADVAVNRMKAEESSGYLFYSAEMNQRAKEKWQLEGELRHALVAQQLVLYYQPKVSLHTGEIVGAEALIRWRHPVNGMVSPAKFIPVAEETGLILDIGSWVLDEACRQLRAWQDAGLHMPPIAVNLSARQFDRLLPQRLWAVLERHQLSPKLLQLEITESLLVRGAEGVISIMNELVAMGLALSMDDFGTGYSSLSYLKKFPITTLKIDRAFVIGVPADENDCAIARAIVTLAKQLRQELVAEGVETPEQMAFLRGLGCDQLQGYLFSPPVTVPEFERMVQSGAKLALG
ncbi:GGDEF domain-containing phosphodiesterase [Rhodoferax sp.]|uniref:putative bifunctional diguanylate cyclase/phosphodiesterase n=1 Tax=Rhodoferax sp. TaxID=50421 RepID=UPI00261D9E58|nr:GGDEF domain-containing phosphodiesterase [Rhodoferax sp.]MDD5478885.1 EAL domain-containing protein [Rhodoferax sp.]